MKREEIIDLLHQGWTLQRDIEGPAWDLWPPDNEPEWRWESAGYGKVEEMFQTGLLCEIQTLREIEAKAFGLSPNPCYTLKELVAPLTFFDTATDEIIK